MKMQIVDRDNIELIAKIESLGTWEEAHYLFNAHESFDVWTWNGQAYKIYKDSKKSVDNV